MYNCIQWNSQVLVRILSISRAIYISPLLPTCPFKKNTMNIYLQEILIKNEKTGIIRILKCKAKCTIFS